MADVPSSSDVLSLSDVSSSSDVPSPSNVPPLQESLAIGKWDSSTISDSVNGHDPVSATINRNLKELASDVHSYHIIRQQTLDNFNNASTFNSISGQRILSISNEDKDKVEFLLSNAKNADQAQIIFDFILNDINTGHACSSDIAKVDRDTEIFCINNHKIYGAIDKNTYNTRLIQVWNRYNELENSNLQYTSNAKGILRYAVYSEADISSVVGNKGSKVNSISDNDSCNDYVDNFEPSLFDEPSESSSDKSSSSENSNNNSNDRITL